MNAILDLQAVDASTQSAEDVRSLVSSVSLSLCLVSLVSLVLCLP